MARREFLSLRHLPGDDDSSLPSPIQPHLDTLFAEFARSRGRASPTPHSPIGTSSRLGRHEPAAPPVEPAVDLRSLDYVTDYDSHLMCPICHVPFVDPVVLECDHTFCQSCLKEHREGAASGSRCPTCRAILLSATRKASRLIINMCNEIKVRCPNQDCEDVLPRGCIERHATKECLHQRLDCPDPSCEKTTKRKNYVPEQCIHTSHLECDCGAIIELGKGEWLRHKDEECPHTGVTCEECGERIQQNRDHRCKNTDSPESQECPGKPYGCDDQIPPGDLEAHSRTCPLARLAPHLEKQTLLLQALQEQLTMAKVRNEVLETGIDKINDILTDQVLPQISRGENSPTGESSDVEEIERDHIPSATSHRDLLMPAHLRALTPSPDPQTSAQQQQQQHLLALHEGLRGTVTALENDITALHAGLADLDARTSMQVMNETLRIKEDLAHTNAALFSTRSQVQWLLNRERVGAQREAMGMRGRTPSAQPQTFSRSIMGEGEPSSHHPPPPPPPPPPAAVGPEARAGSGSLSTSPVFGPQRRLSGGSQERVKL